MSAEQNSATKSAVETLQATAALPSRYRIEKAIGQGGMGIVFEASDLVLDRKVAIKMLLFEGAKDPSALARFEREAKALASLDHPNILKILSWGLNEKGSPYHVQEFLDGRPLSEEIGEGKWLSESRFYVIFSQTLSAIACAHEAGIIHRDLKPGNIFICSDEHGGPLVKIIDFGIARLDSPQDADSQKLTATNLLLGSPNYMSPEQCKGGKVEQAADIYSLGCVMYEALTGKSPHEGGTPMEVMYRHMTAETGSLERACSDAKKKSLGRLVDSCLQKNPYARPNAAQSLRELNEILGSEHSEEDTISICEEKKTKSASRTKIFFCLIAVLLVGLAIFCFQNFSGRKAKDSGDEVVIVELQKKLESLEKSFSTAKGKSRERAAQDILENVRKMASLKRKSGDPEAAVRSLEKYLNYTYFSPVEGFRTSFWAEAEACYLDMGNYARAETMAMRGLERARSSEPMAHFLQDIALIRIKRHNFRGAEEILMRLTTNAYKHNDFEKHIHVSLGDKMSDSAKYGLLCTSNSLSREKISGSEERMDALLLHQKIVEMLIREGYIDLKNPVENLLKATEELPKDNMNAKKSAAQSYRILAKYYESSGDEKRAEDMRKKAAY